MKKVLITGISGFAGSYLADHLLELNDFDISGTYLNDESLANLSNKEKISLHKVNLLDESSTHDVITAEKPDYVFHLAASASPRESFASPRETYLNNISGQLNILESIKKNNLRDAKILIISSAEVYGHVAPEDLPIDEDTKFNPTNPYAVSKITQDYLGLMYFLTDKLRIIRVRPFNHIGPRQSPSFVVSAFAKKIVEIERGREKTMKVGNLDSKRDFTDVRDMVSAYVLAVEKGVPGQVYNLGSGKSHKISEILDIMVGMSTAGIKIEKDPELIRPSDDPELLCDYSKFTSLTGWKPETRIEETLKDTLDYWRSII